MKILQLNTGLFPDAQTVDAALRLMTQTHEVSAIDITRRDMRESDWDTVIRAILAADQIISI